MNSSVAHAPGLAWICLLVAAVPLTACFEKDDAPVEQEWCDSATLLCWQDPHSSTGLTFQEADQYCQDLVWNGHSNWELPTIFQLRTLIERCDSTDVNGPCQPGSPDVNCIDSECTGNCQGCAQGDGPDTASGGCYWPQDLDGTCGAHWSSTALGDVGGAAWYVNFITAQVGDSAFESTMTVRCVRPMPFMEDVNDVIDDVADAGEDVPDDPDVPGQDAVTSDPGTTDVPSQDMVVVDTIAPGECGSKQQKCDNDMYYECGTGGTWELKDDCYEYWMLCGENSYGGLGCTEYPDCNSSQVGERRCWRTRALKCVTADIDWQLADDCGDYAGMHCESNHPEFKGKCLHDAGLTWVDPATGLEWQRPVFPDHDDAFVNWLAAKAYCEGLTWGDPARDDWRLPTISELRTLVRDCPGTVTGGNCAYTDTCIEDCWEGDCWGCEQWAGPTINVMDEDQGAYIVGEFEYEFTQMSWSMYIWSGTHCEYFTDRPEAQYCRIDFRNGAVEVKYNDADLGYAMCVRVP